MLINGSFLDNQTTFNIFFAVCMISLDDLDILNFNLDVTIPVNVKTTILFVLPIKQCHCFVPSSDPNNSLTAPSLSSMTEKRREREEIKHRWMREGMSREKEAAEAPTDEICGWQGTQKEGHRN